MADTRNDGEITSEHTCAFMDQVLEDIELLRLELGRTRDTRVPMHVRDASPREVYYHAQTIHRKVNQLGVELGAAPVAPPSAAEPARAGPADVLRILESTRDLLNDARAALGLERAMIRRLSSTPLRRAIGKDDADVLTGCLVASRQLNVMLTQAFTSREGFTRLTSALGAIESLLAFHGVPLPPPPPFERRKFPREVFQVLWETCEILREALVGSGVVALELRRGFIGEEPGDVFDIASLIVSELDYVASFLPEKRSPSSSAPPPSPTLPAHNYQLAQQLRAATRSLADAVRARPDWLGTPAR